MLISLAFVPYHHVLLLMGFIIFSVLDAYLVDVHSMLCADFDGFHHLVSAWCISFLEFHVTAISSPSLLYAF